MKFDTLFYSRTCGKDYSWICKPSYVDESIDNKLRPLFLMIESKYNANFFLNEGKATYYFFLEEEYCALCYLYFTNRTDFVGRKIYALEGVCCEKSEARKMWKALFDIICRLCENPKRLRRYMSPELDSEHFLESIDFPEIKTDWLSTFKDAMFANLKDEMNSMDRMYSFIFGTRDADFYPLKLERNYKFGEERKSFARASELEIVPIPSEYCDVSVFFSKYRGEYLMSMVSLTEQEDMIFSYENIDCFWNGTILLSKLYQYQKIVKDEIAAFGYRMKTHAEGRRNIRKTKSLRIEKKSFYECKDNLKIWQMNGELYDGDGYVEEFKEESHALIRQFFQYARRIDSLYFGTHAWETVYILSLSSGIWVFSFGLQSEMRNSKIRKHYVFDGIYIPSETKQMGWTYLDSIMDKYVLNKRQYSQAFISAYEKCQQDMTKCTHPFSCVVTSLPDGNFPELSGLKVYTTNGKKNLFQAEIKVWNGEGLPSLLDERKLRLKSYRIVAPALYRKTWYLEGKGLRKEKWTLESIEENSCEMTQLWEEVCVCEPRLFECLDMD